MIKDPQQRVSAKMGFEYDQKIWKNYDFRCLKPKHKLATEDWPHHEMKAYRLAKTKPERLNVKEIKFDKYFFNFEDPYIFKEIMERKEKGEYMEKNIWL